MREKGPRLAGKTYNSQAVQSSAPKTARAPHDIETNVASGRRGLGTETSVSDITSAADNLITIDSTRLQQRKHIKMTTIHLKDEMFGRLKLFTKGGGFGVFEKYVFHL